MMQMAPGTGAFVAAQIQLFEQTTETQQQVPLRQSMRRHSHESTADAVHLTPRRGAVSLTRFTRRPSMMPSTLSTSSVITPTCRRNWVLRDAPQALNATVVQSKHVTVIPIVATGATTASLRNRWVEKC